MEILKKIKEHWKIISSFIIAIWAVFTFYQSYLDNNEEVLERLKTTQQMALKSVIWNDSIPLGERTSACDVYLDAGYNSLTKKHCEKIINESVAINTFLDGKEE